MTPEQQAANLAQIAQAAVKSEKLTGCPAELTAAQCILESGWLQFAPQFNCFGIKSYAGELGRQLLATWEVFTAEQLQAFLEQGDGRSAVHTSGNTYRVTDYFATFATLADCFVRRAMIWDIGVYAPAANDYKSDGSPGALERYVRAIAIHYATDPAYGDKIMTLIDQPNVKQALVVAREVV